MTVVTQPTNPNVYGIYIKINNISIPLLHPNTHLIQVDIPDGEPLADEHDDGAAEAVHAALVQAADARHLAQVLRVRAPE